MTKRSAKYGYRMRLYLLLYDIFVSEWNYYKILLGTPRDPPWVARLADRIFGPRIYNAEGKKPMMKIQVRFKRWFCEFYKHKMRGPYPIGEPGEVRYICKRCKLIVLIRDHQIIRLRNPDDPLVRLEELLRSHNLM